MTIAEQAVTARFWLSGIEVAATLTAMTVNGEKALTAVRVLVDSGGAAPHVTPFGTSAGVPSNTTNPDSRLNKYRNPTGIWPVDKENLWQILDDELRTDTGWTSANGDLVQPILKMMHVYQDYIPTTWLNTISSRDVDRGIDSLQNIRMKSSAGAELVASLSVGASAAVTPLTAYIADIAMRLDPARTVYLVMEHEPEAETARYTATTWRAAFAQFARIVVANRGTKKIVPATCLMRYTLDAASGQTPGNWNCSAELLAQGVPLSEVVFTVDGYASDPTTRPASDIIVPWITLAKTWGFTRFAISETGIHSDTATYAAAAPGWIDGLAQTADQYGLEYICWFSSGVGTIAGPLGWWWAYDQNMRKRVASLCRYGKYAP
jgi:hypothetical protein